MAKKITAILLAIMLMFNTLPALAIDWDALFEDPQIDIIQQDGWRLEWDAEQGRHVMEAVDDPAPEMEVYHPHFHPAQIYAYPSDPGSWPPSPHTPFAGIVPAVIPVPLPLLPPAVVAAERVVQSISGVNQTGGESNDTFVGSASRQYRYTLVNSRCWHTVTNSGDPCSLSPAHVSDACSSCMSIINMQIADINQQNRALRQSGEEGPALWNYGRTGYHWSVITGSARPIPFVSVPIEDIFEMFRDVTTVASDFLVSQYGNAPDFQDWLQNPFSPWISQIGGGGNAVPVIRTSDLGQSGARLWQWVTTAPTTVDGANQGINIRREHPSYQQLRELVFAASPRIKVERGVYTLGQQRVWLPQHNFSPVARSLYRDGNFIRDIVSASIEPGTQIVGFIRIYDTNFRTGYYVAIFEDPGNSTSAYASRLRLLPVATNQPNRDPAPGLGMALTFSPWITDPEGTLEAVRARLGYYPYVLLAMPGLLPDGNVDWDEFDATMAALAAAVYEGEITQQELLEELIRPAEAVTAPPPPVGTITPEEQRGWWSTLWGWLNNIWQGIQTIASSIISLPGLIAAALVGDMIINLDPLMGEDGARMRLTTVFPFSIPFSLVAIIQAFNVPATPPELAIDFGQSGVMFFQDLPPIRFPWEDWLTGVRIVRWIVGISFVVSLMALSPKIIRW